MHRQEHSELSPPLLVSEREAGRLLGVTPRMVFSLRRAGALPAVKIGARVLYSLSALEQFIADRSATRSSNPQEVAHAR